MNDLWRLDLNLLTWEQLVTENAPIMRSGHSVVRYMDYMLLFGGIFEITKELNDLHLFDLVSGKSCNYTPVQGAQGQGAYKYVACVRVL